MKLIMKALLRILTAPLVLLLIVMCGLGWCLSKALNGLFTLWMEKDLTAIGRMVILCT